MAEIGVTLDDRALKERLSKMSLRALHPAAALERAGDEIAELYQDSFVREAEPETGSPWAPLSQRTQEAFVYPHHRGVSAERKRRRRRQSRVQRGAEHILQRTLPGWLYRHIAARVSASGFTLRVGEAGSGAISHRQQFGEGKTPARPFIQVGAKTKEILRRALSNWLFH